MRDIHILDWMVMAVYFASMAWMGLYFSKKNRDTEQYFVGGRRFRGWVIGLSLVGTSISSISFLAYPADAFKTGWLRMLPNYLMPLAAVAAIAFFIPFYRRGRMTSAYQYLGLRFGNGIRLYGSAAFILSQCTRLGIVLFLLGELMMTLVGWPLWLSIMAAGLIVAMYTIAGGFDAVVWTDVIQTLVLIIGGILIMIYIVAHIPGGLATVVKEALADGKLSCTDVRGGQLVPIGWGWAISEKTGLMMLLLGLTWWLQEFATDQNVVQRYCGAASDAEARKAVIWSVATRLPVWAFFMFIGTALYVFFKFHPAGPAAEMLTGTAKPEGILPFFIMHYLPPGVTGLVIAAAVAAAMSSLDSSMNAIAAVFVTDMYRVRSPGRSEKHYLTVARFTVTAAALIMILLAIAVAYADTGTIQDVSTMAGSVLGSGLLGLFLFGFFTTWANARAVGTGIAVTIIYTIYTLLGKEGWVPLPPFDLYYTAIVGNILLFGVSAALSCLIPQKPQRDLTNLTVWTMTHESTPSG